jgi:two-component system nitrogen regulation sensor histidine kinase NtrY
MVEEFVSFARMPAPVFAPHDLADMLQKVVFSEKVAHPEITYEIHHDGSVLEMKMDERQLGRMFGNLYKNAAEAIERAMEASGDLQGKISTSLTVEEEGSRIHVKIEDNGPGFPENLMHRIMEPYVTTREKGTGLGLAIAKKIAEEHSGELSLGNLEQGGAIINIVFRVDSDKNVTYGVANW